MVHHLLQPVSPFLRPLPARGWDNYFSRLVKDESVVVLVLPQVFPDEGLHLRLLEATTPRVRGGSGRVMNKPLLENKT